MLDARSGPWSRIAPPGLSDPLELQTLPGRALLPQDSQAGRWLPPLAGSSQYVTLGGYRRRQRRDAPACL